MDTQGNLVARMIRFGTSGWRAIISDTFTFRNVRLVTQAIANLLLREGSATRQVVIGYDTRFLSERVAAETAKVLSANRIRGLLCSRDAPTPAVSLEIRRRGADGGIYFTASHNTPEYNGLKYYDSRGAPAPPEITDRIELEILCLENEGFDRQYLEDQRYVTSIDPQESYVKHLQQSVDLGRIRAAGLKLSLDLLFGTSRDYLDRLLIENDCAAELIHNFTDPYFGGYTPECSEANLVELKRLVQETGSQLGLATDGDGDRFGILAEDGSLVPPGEVLALLLDYLVRERGLGGPIARTVATSHLIDKVAARHGLEVRETPVGFKYIAALLLSGEATFGGEESAGFTLASHLPEKDGIFACLLTAEMLAFHGRPLSEVRRRLWEEHGPHLQKRTVLGATPEMEANLDAAVAKPPERLEGRPVISASRIDGLKLAFGDGSWCLLRRSGTEPVIRIYVESSSQAELEGLLHGARELLLKRPA